MVSNITFVISGASCQSAQSLDFNYTQECICEKLRGKAWSQIKCGRFETHFFWQFQSCSKWCNKVARCFNGSAYWSRQCSAMFYQSSPSLILATNDNASSPVMDTFRVQPCPSLRRNEFAVRVLRYNYSVNGTERGKWT